uniref:Copper transport protein n=1 Tax=Acrobeloides nanus TaxID=290746 RepID=A0A914DXB1_9BILA
MYESIHYARAVAFKHAKENQPCCAADLARGNGNSTSTHRSVPGAEPPKCDYSTNDMQVKHSIFHNSPLAKKNLLNRYHFLQTAMYFIQVYISYSLMMVAMTYN